MLNNNVSRYFKMGKRNEKNKKTKCFLFQHLNSQNFILNSLQNIYCIFANQISKFGFKIMLYYIEKRVLQNVSRQQVGSRNNIFTIY